MFGGFLFRCVVLPRAAGQGVVPPQYFSKVVDLKTGEGVVEMPGVALTWPMVDARFSHRLPSEYQPPIKPLSPSRGTTGVPDLADPGYLVSHEASAF